MKTYTKHIVIHTDVIVKAETKEDAEKIFNETTLTNSEICEGELVDQASDWVELEQK